MLFLPSIRGHAVGATTFLFPARNPQIVGSVKRKNAKTGELEPALCLEEVAFTAYYPADLTNINVNQGVDWMLRPLNETLRGFVTFAGFSPWLLWPVVYLFGSLLKMPAYPNAPLLNPASEASKRHLASENGQWPLVIFSHGLGGSRNAYSQLCMRLAASGRVVLALEHRDGTGHACVPRTQLPDGTTAPKPVVYLPERDALWDDEQMAPPETRGPLPLRTEQLEFRRHEVHIAYQAFCDLVNGKHESLIETVEHAMPFDRSSWTSSGTASGKTPVRIDQNVSLAGHSFGGCTLLSLLSTPASDGYLPIPVDRVLVLDPWLEPLSTPQPPSVEDPPSAADDVTGAVNVEKVAESSPHCGYITPAPEMMVINSEAFTKWADHFSRLEDMVKSWKGPNARLITLVGSQHISFSDFPLLPLVRKQAATVFMDIIGKLSVAFFDGTTEDCLGELSTRELEYEVIGTRPDGKPKRKIVGEVGDVVVSQ